MTEIVQSNNSMKFDLLDTANGGTDISGSAGLFNSLLGNVDANSGDGLQDYDAFDNEDKIAEGNVFQILTLLKESELNLSEDTLNKIETHLNELFQKIELNVGSQGTLTPDQASSNSNQNFLYLMNFLEELKALIVNQEKNRNINQELDFILDKVRTKLNELIKNTLARVIHKGSEKDVVRNKVPNQTDINSSENQSTFGKDISSATNRSQKQLEDLQTRRINFGNLKNTELKARSEKKFSTKPKGLNISQHQESKISQIQSMGGNPIEKSTDASNQNPINAVLSKETNLDPSLFRQTVALSNKLDSVSNSDPANVQKPLTSSQENNDKLLQTLNMLSKTWGNKLIEKIEKSIVDGIEKLEIALTPKSLGRLNVTISIYDAVAKINIIAESAGAAALLSEAEHKLSQMMEASGLKLVSLQTLSQQFGNNKKGKEQDQKLASTFKKSSIEKTSNSPEQSSKIESENEGINVIA